MTERDTLAGLSEGELACLRHLIQYPDDGLSHFSESVVERLVSAGLVDSVPTTVLPILPQSRRYRLTSRGRAMISAERR